MDGTCEGDSRSGLFGPSLGFGLEGFAFSFDVGGAAFAFFHFVVLSAHKNESLHFRLTAFV